MEPLGIPGELDLAPFSPCSPSFRPADGDACRGSFASPVSLPKHAASAVDEDQLWRFSPALAFVCYKVVRDSVR
eukprot:gene11556-biopygen7824